MRRARNGTARWVATLGLRPTSRVIVVDASVLANALTDDAALGKAGRAELAKDPYWLAPEHVIVETFCAIRGRHLGGQVSTKRARDAMEVLTEFAIELVGTKQLLPRMWQLRCNVTDTTPPTSPPPKSMPAHWSPPMSA